MRGQKVMDTFYDRLKETWSYHTHHPGLPVRVKGSERGLGCQGRFSARRADALMFGYSAFTRKASRVLVRDCLPSRCMCVPPSTAATDAVEGQNVPPTYVVNAKAPKPK